MTSEEERAAAVAIHERVTTPTSEPEQELAAYIAMMDAGKEPASPEMIATAKAELALPGLDECDNAIIYWAHANAIPITEHLPEEGRVRIVMSNVDALKNKGTLEKSWLTAYVYAVDFETTTLDDLQQMFEECDRDILHEGLHELDEAMPDDKEFMLFRGVAGPDHRMGMSWTSSLGKAIYYATVHAERSSAPPTVYAACVDRSEICCFMKLNEPEFITRPKEWWKVNVPDSWFRYDIPRNAQPPCRREHVKLADKGRT